MPDNDNTFTKEEIEELIELQHADKLQRIGKLSDGDTFTKEEISELVELQRADKIDECEIPRDRCIDLSYLIEAAQRDINNNNRMIEMVSKLPNVPSKFVNEIKKSKERDEKSLVDAIEVLKNCGCKDIGLSVLFA